MRLAEITRTYAQVLLKDPGKVERILITQITGNLINSQVCGD